MKDLQHCFDDLLHWMPDSELGAWEPSLRQLLQRKLETVNHGDLPGWVDTLKSLPDVQAKHHNFTGARVEIGHPDELSEAQQQALHQGLKKLMPWRKGPYQLFDTHIDTEWRSDFKWDRVQPHLTPLNNRLVLDIGCGNGYHLWRMYSEGARRVIGIDPSWKFLIQFQAIKQYLQQPPVDLLPLGIEHMPAKMKAFDTVFSMGVFYHRKSPMDHLQELLNLLRPGGELVLETLIIPGDENQVLLPTDRYAQMRNVWFLPSVDALTRWMYRTGFKEVRCVDINQTSTAEQRSTEWMTFHSLADFLDPQNPNLTIEGYPAPTRATLIAQAPF